jgi:hypothetical protein
MVALAVRLLSSIGSAISIFAFLNTPGTSWDAWQVVLLTLTMLGVLAVILLDIVSEWRNRPKSFVPNDPKIKEYMFNWLQSGGRAAIFSRDISWANDNSIKSLLTRKAKNHELVLCLPKMTILAEELENLGAEVHVYPSLQYEPQSRFTIINKGRGDARVAVGTIIGRKHVIREFQAGHDPFFSVANDLLEVICRL